MQLDAEEDENAFYKPPVEPAARATAERLSGETATDSKAAAMVTAEDDDEDDE
jgi:sorting nexin-1/2